MAAPRLSAGAKTGVAGGVLALMIAVVGAYEGLRTKAYKDPIGIPTICYGETRGVHIGDHETRDACDAMLGSRLAEFSAEVNKCLLRPVPGKAYAAFVSLAYNIGSAAFCKSSVVKLANAGAVASACQAILKFNRAGGRVLPGLDSRRHGERDLCMEGVRGK